MQSCPDHVLAQEGGFLRPDGGESVLRAQEGGFLRPDEDENTLRAHEGGVLRPDCGFLGRGVDFERDLCYICKLYKVTVYV